MSTEIPNGLPAGATAFPASDVRPEGYPAELPFVPGVACLVHEGKNPQGGFVRTCTWMAADEDTAAVDRWRALVTPLAGKVAELPLVGALMKQMGVGGPRSAEGSSRTAAEAASLVGTAPRDERDTLLEVGRVQQEALRAAPDIEGAVERVARVVVEVSLADGWAVESEQTIPFPARVHIMKMRRGDRSRGITRMAAAFGGTVTLSDTAARDG